MKNFYLLFLLLTPLLNFAQTTISGGTLSGTLSKASSPYYVSDNVTVPADSLLIVEAGVTMDFADTVKLIVRGNIKCIGTSSDKIMLTCSDSLVGWGGVVIVNNPDSDTNSFDYCLVEYTHSSNRQFTWLKQPGFNSSIRSVGIQSMASSPLRIKNSTFRRVNSGVDVRDGDCWMSDCKFFDNQPFGSYSISKNLTSGILLRGNFKVSDCTFINCYSGISVGEVTNGEEFNIENCFFQDIYSDAIGLSKLANITSCYFKNNEFTTLRLFDFTGVVDNCTFDGTFGESIFAGDVSFTRNCTKGVIQNCTFKNSTTTAGCIGGKEASASMIYNCKFINNRRAIGLIRDVSHARIINCLFTRNSIGITTTEDVTMINCAFVNNYRKWKSPTDNTTYPRNSSAAEYVDNAHFKFYNCIFWNNRNYYGDVVNLSIDEGNKVPSEFYNCILGGGTSTIQDRFDSTFTFSGVYQDCLEDYPKFKDTANGDFTLTQTCSRRPYGFNKGYAQPIPIYYKGSVHADILSKLSDLNGYERIWDDTSDIGPFEVQALADRIDVEEMPADIELCEALSDTLTGIARGVNLTSLWEKSDNGSAFLSASNNTSKFPFSSLQDSDSGDRYRVYWYNQCGDAFYSDTATIHVHTPQDISLGGDFKLPRDSSAKLSPGEGFVNYAWNTQDSFDTLNIVGQDFTHGDYTYSVTVLDKFGCSSSAEITITVISGAGIEQTPQNLKLYPNPGIDFIKVGDIHQGELRIYNLQGALVMTKQLFSNSINVQGLDSGIYIVEIRNDNGVYRGRWVKE